jgi:hypothetical protein
MISGDITGGGAGAARRENAACMRAGNEFWAEFRERAKGLPRNEPSRQPALPAVLFSAFLLAAGIGVALLAVRPAGAAAAVVESLEIAADHSGVVVIQGSGENPTIVWILDMPSDKGDKSP